LQGIKSNEQGNFSPHQGIRSRPLFGKQHDLGNKVGAYQTFELGRSSNVNCACHWTINVAASVGHGKLYPHAYSVAPAAVFVPPESDIAHPAQLAGVPISVGYSRAAITRRYRPWNNTLRRWRSICRSPTGCFFAAWIC